MHVLTAHRRSDNEHARVDESFQQRHEDKVSFSRRELYGIGVQQFAASIEAYIVNTHRGRRLVISLDVFTMMPRAKPARIAGQPRTVRRKCNVEPPSRDPFIGSVDCDLSVVHCFPSHYRSPKTSDEAHGLQSVGFEIVARRNSLHDSRKLLQRRRVRKRLTVDHSFALDHPLHGADTSHHPCPCTWSGSSTPFVV